MNWKMMGVRIGNRWRRFARLFRNRSGDYMLVMVEGVKLDGSPIKFRVKVPRREIGTVANSVFNNPETRAAEVFVRRVKMGKSYSGEGPLRTFQSGHFICDRA